MIMSNQASCLILISIHVPEDIQHFDPTQVETKKISRLVIMSKYCINYCKLIRILLRL